VKRRMVGRLSRRLLSTILVITLFSGFPGEVNRVEGGETTVRDISIGVMLGAGTVLFSRLLPSLFSGSNTELPPPGGFNPFAAESVQPMFYCEYPALADKDLFVGHPSVMAEVAEFVDAVKSFAKYRPLGAKKLKTLLIQAPQGNGKTLLASVIAHELQACLIPISGYFLANEAYGPGEAKLKFLFDFGRRLAQAKRTVLFIDDFDVFAQDNFLIGGSHPFDMLRQGALHALAEQIAAIGPTDNLIIIGAVRTGAQLDRQLCHPGCFDRTINIPLPTEQGREEILKCYLQNVDEQQGRDTQELAELSSQIAGITAGFTSLLLKELVHESALIAGQEGCEQSTFTHAERAHKKLQFRKWIKSHGTSVTCGRLISGGDDLPFAYTFSEKTRFEDVIGRETELTEIEEVLDFLKNPECYTHLGARRPRGLLLYGPSGCGKTLIARAIAGEASCCFISLSGSEFVNKFVGSGPSRVRDLFDFARKMACQMSVIIFIDELDGLGRREASDASSASSEYNNTINEMLRQMDGFESAENILVVGATNRLEELDPALVRSGRFDRKVLIPLPAINARAAILEHYAKKIRLDQSLTGSALGKEFSGRTFGLSGADLENLINEAAILAGREQAVTVTRNHFEAALDKTLFGLKSSVERSPRARQRTAYHEAGHTLVALLKNMPIVKVSILSRGHMLGVTQKQNKDDGDEQQTKSELIHEIMCLQGGFIAEQMMLGEPTPGAYDDLKKGSRLANSMIKTFGMGEHELEGIACVGFSSDVVKQQFDAAVVALLSKTFVQTKELLTANKEKLVTLAQELLEKEELSGAEVARLVD